MKTRGGSLAIANPNEKIRRVFDVTKMTEIIPAYETTEEAVANI